MKTLRSILPSNVESTGGPLDIEITGIAYDSRKVKKGNLFVALPGQHIDGCTFIFDALERGAAAIMLEGIRKNIEVSIVKVSDARKALSEAAALFYDNPTKSLKLFGITGTKGKTTITYLVQSILRQAYGSAFRIGTIEYDLEIEKITAVNTTPESASIQEMSQKCLYNGIKNGVIEVSSHGLKNWRVKNLNFAVAAFTNLSLEHTEFHPDMEDYFNTKKKLFTEIESLNKPCIIGIDCDYGIRMAKECKEAGLKTKTVSVHNHDADYYCENLRMSGIGSDFQICTRNGEKNQCHLNIPGEYNVFNALMAAAMCTEAGVNNEYISAGILALKNVPGRLETIPNSSGINVVVDYAHSPDALKNVLTAMKEITKNKMITVFGCGGNRSREKRPIMGKVAYDYSDVVVVTSDNPRNEDPDEIIKQILSGISDDNTQKTVINDADRKVAINTALKLAKAGDTVVIAGKGHETGQYFSDRTVAFDDREIALSFFKVTEHG